MVKLKRKTESKIQAIIFIITSCLLIMAISFLLYTDSASQRDRLLFSCFQMICMLLVIIIPKRIKEKYDFEIPLKLETLFVAFAFCGFILGDVLDFYHKIPVWDSILHTLSGVILAYCGFLIIEWLVKRDVFEIHLSKLFICIAVVLFSLSLGAIWEIGEYTYDDIFGTNTQQFMATTESSVTDSNDVALVGHDALTDTIKDLALDLVGAVGFSVIVYFNHSYETKKTRNNNIE